MKSRILYKRKKVFLSVSAALLFGLLFYLFSHLFYNDYYIKIPVKFNFANVPILEMEIEENYYPISLDIGSKLPLVLKKEVLEKMKKRPHGISQWRDAKGNFYESPSYFISEIKIGSLVLKNIIVTEENEDCGKNSTMMDNSTSPDPNEKFGSLGKPILDKFNLLLDLANSEIIACKTLHKLAKSGYDIDKLVKIPLEEGRGLILSVETDLGKKRFDLDTGATINFIRSSLVKNIECSQEEHGFKVYTTSKFELGEKEFGEVEFFLYDISPDLHEIDGTLGMRFLENHIIYIDYPNKVAYVGFPSTH